MDRTIITSDVLVIGGSGAGVMSAVAATLLCPSIIKLGVPALAAHFFVFYFANLSMITPPVALSSFTAAGIVNDNMWKLGLTAFKYSFIIFLIPYTFVYGPAMLFIGTPLEIAQVTVFCLIGAYGLSMSLIGYGIAPMKLLERPIAVAAAICMVVPELISSLVGLAIMVALLALQVMRKKMTKAAA